MSKMQFLNGKLQGHEDDEDVEVVPAFIREQGADVPVSTRLEVASAFEAELRGNLDVAETKYRNVLSSVKESHVLDRCLDRIRRRRDR